jgi:hypothetical protein
MLSMAPSTTLIPNVISAPSKAGPAGGGASLKSGFVSQDYLHIGPNIDEECELLCFVHLDGQYVFNCSRVGSYETSNIGRSWESAHGRSGIIARHSRGK